MGLCVSGSEKPEVKLKWAFKMYDIDENGYISRSEMLSMLRVSLFMSLFVALAFLYTGMSCSKST